LEEVLIPLGRRSQGIGSPHRPDARVILFGIWVFSSEMESFGLQLINDVFGRWFPFGFRLVGDVQGVTVERGVTWLPAQSGRQRDRVRGGHTSKFSLASPRCELIGTKLVIAPLIGVNVPKGGLGLLPWWLRPVQGVG